jgi:hypothetical protein
MKQEQLDAYGLILDLAWDAIMAGRFEEAKKLDFLMQHMLIARTESSEKG